MRLIFLAPLVLLTACSSSTPKAPILPETAGAWIRTAAQQETTPMAGAHRAWSATYRGSPEMTLTVHEMTGGSSAFEALQHWRPERGKLAYNQNAFFLVAESPSADVRTLDRFLTAVMTALR